MFPQKDSIYLVHKSNYCIEVWFFHANQGWLGGFAVFKATLDDIQTVALKVLNVDTEAPTKNQLQKFQDEINVIRACRFEHIVRFLGSWTEDVSPAHHSAQHLTALHVSLICVAQAASWAAIVTPAS